MKAGTARLPGPVTASVLCGLMCCMAPVHPLAQTVVQTNIVVVINGSTTTNGTNAVMGYAGEGSAVFGWVQGIASLASTSLLSATGGVQEASATETTLSSGLAVGNCEATVIGQNQVTSSQASVANVSHTGCSGFLADGT